MAGPLTQNMHTHTLNILSTIAWFSLGPFQDGLYVTDGDGPQLNWRCQKAGHRKGMLCIQDVQSDQPHSRPLWPFWCQMHDTSAFYPSCMLLLVLSAFLHLPQPASFFSKAPRYSRQGSGPLQARTIAYWPVMLSFPVGWEGLEGLTISMFPTVCLGHPKDYIGV